MDVNILSFIFHVTKLGKVLYIVRKSAYFTLHDSEKKRPLSALLKAEMK